MCRKFLVRGGVHFLSRKVVFKNFNVSLQIVVLTLVVTLIFKISVYMPNGIFLLYVYV